MSPFFTVLLLWFVAVLEAVVTWGGIQFWKQGDKFPAVIFFLLVAGSAAAFIYLLIGGIQS